MTGSRSIHLFKTPIALNKDLKLHILTNFDLDPRKQACQKLAIFRL